MLLDILGYIVLGLIVGALGRLVIPGANPMAWWMTILLGIVGAVFGGIITRVVIGGGHGIIQFVISVAIAALLVVLYGRTSGRTTT